MKLAMKISISILFICFFSFSVSANNPTLESTEKKTALELEISSIIEEILNKNTETNNALIDEQCKIIIINSEFKKIKEESIEKIDDICTQSTLVPIIYRSEFIMKIYNVSYYMLQKD
ncbi:MAG: hypothetical protein KAI29_09080 [Cyclobacteriaceae bacterium]|nr:hypothetical protein [Cyclobacteriaceae bacterium]